jgi:hypothetical protein
VAVMAMIVTSAIRNFSEIITTITGTTIAEVNSKRKDIE